MDEDNNQANSQGAESAASSGEDKSTKGPMLYLALAVAFLALIGLAFFLFSRQETEEVATEITDAEELFQAENSVTPSNVITDDGLFIAEATLAQNGFISVHEAEEGSIGDSIGVSNFLLAGNYSNVYIPLTREAVEAENLYVMIIADDGDGVFGYPATDDFAYDQLGIPVGSVITVSLSEPFEEEEEAVEEEVEEEEETEEAQPEETTE
jgi:hypothetical protein